QRALEKGVTLEQILQVVRRIRQKTSIPIALMTYYNPVFHFGEESFIAKAKAAGVDGLIIPDLPPEEGERLIKAARRHQMATVFFLAPTSTKARMKKIAQASTGFIYYVSITGVTGARNALPEKDIFKNISAAKRLTNKPICVGF